MILKTRTILGVIICILLLCSSCSNQIDPLSVPSPNIGVPVQGDKYLEITTPAGWNSFKTSDPVSLLIRNISNQKLITEKDFNARIFLFSKDKWVEINNGGHYFNNEITLEPSKSFDPSKIVGVIIWPELPNDSTPSYIRIFVTGTLIQDDQTKEEIASYIDVRLNP